MSRLANPLPKNLRYLLHLEKNSDSLPADLSDSIPHNLHATFRPQMDGSPDASQIHQPRRFCLRAFALAGPSSSTSVQSLIILIIQLSGQMSFS